VIFVLEVVQISYSKFRIDYELKLGSRIKKSELPFMQQKAYMEAVEDVFDAFQLELKLNVRYDGPCDDVRRSRRRKTLGKIR